MLRKASRASKGRFLGYKKLKPAVILRLNQSDPEALASTAAQLKQLSSADVLVVSHEFLARQFVAVRNICDIGEALGFDSIQIIGYTRRQDQWHRSSFNQWSFRNINQLRRGKHSLKVLQCDWRLFSAYERWLITCLIDQEGPDWNEHYKQHQAAIEHHTLPIAIDSSPVPTSCEPAALLHHFNQTCKLGIGESFIETCTPIENSSFSEYITESIAESILESNSDQYPITPHSNNLLLRDLSAGLPKRIPALNQTFIDQLQRQYIDLFKQGNQEYCQQFNISYLNTFGTPEKLSSLSRAAIKAMIQDENRRRSYTSETIAANKAEIHARCIKVMLQQLQKTSTK